MNKETYLANKRKLLEAVPVYKKETLCLVCRRIEKNCLCQLIKPFNTETHFVILMHPREARKERVGTARICAATLRNSQIIEGVDFTHDKQVNELIRDPNNLCMVMYPGEKALNVSSGDIAPLIELKSQNRKLVLFLIDGTWSCAKKMMTLSWNIRRLPRLSFNIDRESLFVIKQQPADYCLSTLESIHVYLSECHRRGFENLAMKQQDNLLEVFQTVIDFQIKCSLDPSLPRYRQKLTGFTPKDQRSAAKKWQSRKIILND